MRRNILFGLVLLNDMIIIALAPLAALFLRLDALADSRFYPVLLAVLPIVVGVHMVVFCLFGLHNRLWRYAGTHEIMLLAGAVTVSALLLILGMVIGDVDLPRSLPIINWMFTVILLSGSRLAVRVLYHLALFQGRKIGFISNVLIVGAGDTGVMIAQEIHQRQYEEKQVVGFIDDSSYKVGQKLLGVKVLGSRRDIPDVIAGHDIREVIVAMPSASPAAIREIAMVCKRQQCSVKIVPGIYELMERKDPVRQLREVDLEDLLRRSPVRLDLEYIGRYLKHKRVLVTGAGGSIGSELCRQIAAMSPGWLILLGKGENSIYEIQSEISGRYGQVKTAPVIADVRDARRMREVFQQYEPEVVFHAAAHKHVPLMEMQPGEAVGNNVFGTRNVAEAAAAAGTELFVMISTDKAVNPTSVMGATKRVAELVVQHMNAAVGKTKFIAVRFGNVLGSRGSVVPLFKQQIARGGPLTITHPDMRRYFMTIPEASQLVLQAGSMAKGGEVFVLDMGEPVRIVDMACDLIRLSGLEPHQDIQFAYVGLRPGEKMVEELLTAEEGTRTSKHKQIFVANLKPVDARQLTTALAALQALTDEQQIVEMLSALVPSYHRDSRVLDKPQERPETAADANFAAANLPQYQPAVGGSS